MRRAHRSDVVPLARAEAEAARRLLGVLLRRLMCGRLVKRAVVARDRRSKTRAEASPPVDQRTVAFASGLRAAADAKDTHADATVV